MKNYFKKFSIMFIMSLILMLGCCTSAFALDTTESITINNSTLTFNKIIYVDGTNGNDTICDGSKSKPFSTLSKAASIVDTENTLIYILTPNTYPVPDGLEKLFSSDYTLTFATPEKNFGKVTIDLQSIGSNLNLKMNKLNKFIGLNFIRTKGNDPRTFETFYDGGVVNYEFDNCAFLSSSFMPNPIITIANGNSSGCAVTKADYNNCSVSSNISWNFTKNGFAYNKSIFANCAFVGSKVIDYQPNLNGAKFDEDLNITSDGWKNTGIGTNPDGTQANIGVYGGEFAWGNRNSESISLNKPSMPLIVGTSE